MKHSYYYNLKSTANPAVLTDLDREPARPPDPEPAVSRRG